MLIPIQKLFLKLSLGLVLLSLFGKTFAQRIQNESVIRNMNSDHYFRLYYENDFIVLTDCYYTSGMNLEFVAPSFKKNPLNHLFFQVKGNQTKYGIAIDHYAFTPIDYVDSKIIYGDRPYAGCLSVNSFKMTTDENKRKKISTSFMIGLIGPVTHWKSLQKFLHEYVVKAPVPQGWDNQIQNDLILSYKINAEKNFIKSGFFLLNGNAEAVAGTINDKVSTGLSVMTGKMNDPFISQQTGEKKAWELYFFGHSFVTAVGYDATLQGGMINKTSPYTLSGSQINHITFQNQIGMLFSYGKFSLELSESFLSKEFKTGLRHIWGGAGIGFEL